jgi:uncharacterized protein (TIGR02302 family)
MNEAPRIAAPDGGVPGQGKSRLSRFERLIERARLALLWERLWPGLWPPFGVVALFLAVSWMGLWLVLPPTGRIIGCGLALAGFLASLIPLIRLTLPSRRHALTRLDRDAAVSHRPATAFDDALALGQQDPATRALWEAHRRRAEEGLARLKVRAPRPNMSSRDRFALRAAAIVALVTGAFVAGQDFDSRLSSAFDWKGARGLGPEFRIDGWVDPPLYTRLPPIILDFRSTAQAHKIRVPVKSTMVIRAAGKTSLEIAVDQGLEALPATAQSKPDLKESRFTVAGNAKLRVLADGATVSSFVVEAIPDRPPEIKLSGPPQSNGRGSLTIGYTASDDYGLASAEGVFERDGAGAVKPLVPAPRAPLSLPNGAANEETKTTTDLSSHPWAGARVKLTLVARDEAGQEGRSETITVTLPQRPFTKPLARALVEQRRNLIIEPQRQQRVQMALDALTTSPEVFTPEIGVYLGLRVVAERLRRAKSDVDLLEVAEFLWQMALTIEDGDLSDSERALRQAQEALRQALERGASEDEIKRLTQDLRQALDRFLRDFAERQGRNQAQNDRLDPNTRAITPNDLKNLLDRLEELARQGATADAQRLLEELRGILDNLQMARPGGRQPDPLTRELNRALDELDQMSRDQQALRDETFRDGQRRQNEPRGQRNQRRGESGRQGERQRGQRQQGQQGQQGDGEQMDGEDGQGDQAGEGLSRRQQALRERLQELKRRMRGLGMQGEQGLDDAESAMGEAEQSLGQGQPGQAVDAQGRAIDGLRRGAQGLAQQMMGDGTEQAGDDSDGQPGRMSQRGQNGPSDTDPLGRPRRSNDWTDGRVKIPTGDESAVARARRILEELRRRLGEFDRPREELDYFERLLRPR